MSERRHHLAMRLAGAPLCVMFAAGCFASDLPDTSWTDAAVDAELRDAGIDAPTERDAGVCACPCLDPSRACVGQPATVVTLMSIPTATLHRARRTCIDVTYDPALPVPETYVLALRDWMRDCPGALCTRAIEPNDELPRARCESRIHVAPIGAVDALWGNCSGAEGTAGFVADGATGEMREACIEVSPTSGYGFVLRGVGQALGLGFAPAGVASVMADPTLTELQPLDREGFCAAYGGAGFCAE